MQADDARLAKFAHIDDKQRRTYAAMMLAMDDAIGGVRKAIADNGQDENTLVVFISDNGGPTMPGTTINASSNAPLRGSKRTTLEGGIRVPFLARWPGQVKPGVYDQPVIQLDLTPPRSPRPASRSSPNGSSTASICCRYLSGAKAARRTTRSTGGSASRWRFATATTSSSATTSNADTLTGAGGQPVSAAKLYHLSNDIGEAKDLAATMPDKVKELQAKWDAWNAELATPLWGGGAGGKRANKKEIVGCVKRTLGAAKPKSLRRRDCRGACAPGSGARRGST